MEFRLLGPVEVEVGQRLVDAGPPRQRTVLAALLVDAGRPVMVDTIIDRVWGEAPPARARQALYVYMARLRRIPTDPPIRLLRRARGYMLDIDPESVDAHRFDRLIQQGRELDARDARRITLLRQAIELWRGQPLVDLSGEWAAQLREGWRRQYLDAATMLARAEMRAGNANAMIGPLTALVDEHPLVEPLAAELIRALYLAGLSAEALRCYFSLRQRLAAELGIDPSAELQQLHASLLRDCSEPVAVSDSASQSTSVVPGPEPTLCTLPADQVVFVGRDKELDQIATVVTDAAQAGGVIAIHAIDGMPGVGKTALAVHVAHRLKDKFGDRQLFIDLHAHTPGQQPADPLDALADLLAADAADTRTLPDSVDGRAAVWRGRMAGKRMLLVLDNAASSEQVTPLLPGSADCLVLVTSRRSLGDLPPAIPVLLDVLPPAQAVAMVTRLAPHTSGQPEAVAELVAACGYLPLAISITARLLARRRSWTVADLLGEIRQAEGRLLHLTVEQRTIAAVFDLSYVTLALDRQRFFRLLGLQPGLDIDAYAAAALTDTTLHEAQQHLDGLHGDRLLTEPAYRRYGLHDLTRAYTRTLVSTVDSEEARQAAVARLFGFYQHTASRADAHLATHTRLPAITVDTPNAAPPITGWSEAAAWLRAERANLFACIHHTTIAGMPAHTVGLATAIAGLLRLDGPCPQAATLHRAAAAVAQQISDRHGHAVATYDHGEARHLMGDYPAASDLLGQALDLYREVGDPRGEATALCRLGSVRWVTGDYRAASDLLGRAVHLYQAIGYVLGEASALNQLGAAQRLTGDYPAAADTLGRALDLCREVGARRGEAVALSELGVTRRMTADYPAASHLLDQALDLYRALGHAHGEAITHGRLAVVAYLTGDYTHAADLLHQALAVFTETGAKDDQAEALNHLATVRRLTGHPDRARTHHQQALALALSIDHRLEEAHALEGIGRAALDLGHTSTGISHLQQAHTRYKRLGVPEATMVAADLITLMRATHPPALGQVAPAVFVS